jgi:hypothetical protein
MAMPKTNTYSIQTVMSIGEGVSPKFNLSLLWKYVSYGARRSSGIILDYMSFCTNNTVLK